MNLPNFFSMIEYARIEELNREILRVIALSIMLKLVLKSKLVELEKERYKLLISLDRLYKNIKVNQEVFYKEEYKKIHIEIQRLKFNIHDAEKNIFFLQTRIYVNGCN